MGNWRNTGNRLASVGAAVWRGLSAAVGLDELLLAMGLALVSVGLWDVWRPGAFLTPGVLLIWMTLPTRRAFVERRATGATPEMVPRRSSRKDA